MSSSTAYLLPLSGLLGTIGLGYGLVRLLRLNRLPVTLCLGASFPIGVAAFSISILILDTMSVPLSVASRALSFLGLLMALWFCFKRKGAHPTSLTLSVMVSNDWRKKLSPVVITLLALLVIHFVFSLINNLTRPIFPWDALTTWMYRAKVWAMNDALSPILFTPDWLTQISIDAYPIYASHYPKLLSIYVAAISVLTDGWHSAAASLPWSCAWLSLALMMFGAVKAETDSMQIPLASAFGLCSLPLLNAHVALAGYADVWMAVTSGFGLTLLLLWSHKRTTDTLILAVILLGTGTQFKNEGWLWAGIGAAFIAMEYLRKFHRHSVFLLGAATLVALPALQISHISLGPLGEWGISQSAIDIGPLGSYALRPYNALPNYWTALHEQPNFHLIAVLLAVSLLSITRVRGAHSQAFWVMAALIVASQAFIFGVSSFSRYAEFGTAINRLLVHFLPVFIFVIAISFSRFKRTLGSTSSSDSVSQAKNGLLGAFTATFLLAVALMILNPSLLNTDAENLEVDAQQMIPVLGQVERVTAGVRILPSDVPVSVLKAPSLSQLVSNKNIAILDVVAEDANHIRFYWINEVAPSVVHSTIPSHTGRSIVDLAKEANWRDGPLLEWGIIVTPEGFDSTVVKSVSLKDTITFHDAPALLKNWLLPIPPDQRSLNFLRSRDNSLLTVTPALSLAAAICLIVVAISAKIGVPRQVASSLGLATVFALWILSDLLWVRHLVNWASTSAGLTPISATEAISAGVSVNEMGKILEESLKPFDEAIVIPASDDYEFQARKMPFVLLPKKVAFTRYGRLREIRWLYRHRPLVVVGEENTQLDQFAQRIISASETPLQILLARDGLRVLIPKSMPQSG